MVNCEELVSFSGNKSGFYGLSTYANFSLFSQCKTRVVQLTFVYTDLTSIWWWADKTCNSNIFTCLLKSEVSFLLYMFCLFFYRL